MSEDKKTFFWHVIMINFIVNYFGFIDQETCMYQDVPSVISNVSFSAKYVYYTSCHVRERKVTQGQLFYAMISFLLLFVDRRIQTGWGASGFRPPRCRSFVRLYGPIPTLCILASYSRITQEERYLFGLSINSCVSAYFVSITLGKEFY